MSDTIELEDNFVLVVSDQGTATPTAHGASHQVGEADELLLNLSQINDAGSIAPQDANNVAITGGALSGVTFSSSAVTITGGTISVTSVTATTVNLDGGTIDGTVIGSTTRAAGSFTTGSFNSNVGITGTLAVTGAVTLTVPLAVGQGGTGATSTGGIISALGLSTLASMSPASVTLTGGTITNVIIGGGGTPAAGTFTALASTGNATVGGTLGVTGATTGAAASFTTLTSTGGALNGTIGAGTPAAGAFTTGSFSSNVTVTGTLAVTGACTLTALLTANGGITLGDGQNIAVNTTTGTKIGTATTQKIGFWNATPVVQQAAVIDATDAATVITQLNSLLAKLRTIGIIAT